MENVQHSAPMAPDTAQFQRLVVDRLDQLAFTLGAKLKRLQESVPGYSHIDVVAACELRVEKWAAKHSLPPELAEHISRNAIKTYMLMT